MRPTLDQLQALLTNANDRVKVYGAEYTISFRVHLDGDEFPVDACKLSIEPTIVLNEGTCVEGPMAIKAASTAALNTEGLKLYLDAFNRASLFIEACEAHGYARVG